MVVEFGSWLNFWTVVLDKRSPLVIKKCIIKHTPAAFILGLEELLLNVKVRQM